MKKINELRISMTIKYINEYYLSHGVCPTYRQIKEECKYSSLSLVFSDINRLKQRGLLVDGNFKQIKLPEQKEKHIHRYDYHFLVMTDAFYNIDCLNDEEKVLLDAQDNYLKGNYLLAKEESLKLLDSSNDQSVIFGARLTLCWSSLFTGEVNYFKEFFRNMISYNPKTISEKMEKELIAHFLSSILGSKDNCPLWLKEGRFYELRKEAYPLANLLFVANGIKENPPIPSRYLEPLCSEASINHIDVADVYMNLYLALSYHYAEDDKYVKEHLEQAISTCLKHNWLTPLAEMKRSLESVITPILEKYDINLVNKVDELNSKLTNGFNIIYSAVVGDNITKDLTFREIEVINFVRLGLSTKEIANKLFLSSETIKYYLSSIYSKLGISGRKELKALIKNYV